MGQINYNHIIHPQSSETEDDVFFLIPMKPTIISKAAFEKCSLVGEINYYSV